MKPFIPTAVAVLAFIAVVHLFRLFTGWELVVNGFPAPRVATLWKRMR